MSLLHAPLYPLALVGLAALALGGMLAVPLTRPPPMTSIKAGAEKIDHDGAPELSRYQARDGTWLAYRLYPAAGADSGLVAFLVHGSSAASNEMNPMAKALAASGVTALALDVRGHGASGARGDIGYAGQLEDDLADLIAELRKTHPNVRLALIGHSLGGGFAARIAATPVGREFDRFVLVAPFLGPDAPSSGEGNRRWASVDLPRILALTVLRRLGATLGESLPVIAYANDPAASTYLTSVYSYRLLADYGPDFDWATQKQAIRAAAGRIAVVAGADDELMVAAAYERELKPLGVAVVVAPHVDHMGAVTEPTALAAVVAAAKGG
jgi:alpha-beta hydrolase superfamily lysophospholipase